VPVRRTGAYRRKTLYLHIQGEEETIIVEGERKRKRRLEEGRAAYENETLPWKWEGNYM